MNRIFKSVGFSLSGLVLATFSLNLAMGEAEELLGEGALKITIISGSAITGVAALSSARSNGSVALARTSAHSRTAFPGGGGASLISNQATGQPTVGEFVMRGTTVGDVIRLEYVAGTEASLEQAVSDLKRGSQIWEARSVELNRKHAALVEEAQEARRVFTGLPLNEQSKGFRYQALNEMTKVEDELKIVSRSLADTEMRMHAARGQYAAAFRNLQVTQQTHKVNQHYHIIQDVYVDGSPNQLQPVLTRALGEATTAARANQAIPHIRMTRIQSPNSALVQRSVRNLKSGLWAAGISIALIVEEVTVGEISKTLAEQARVHFSPELRTEPATDSARRD